VTHGEEVHTPAGEKSRTEVAEEEDPAEACVLTI